MSARICDTSAGTNALRSRARLPSSRCSSSPPRELELALVDGSRDARAAASGRSRPRTPRRARSRGRARGAPPRRHRRRPQPPARIARARNGVRLLRSRSTRRAPSRASSAPRRTRLCSRRRAALLPEAAVLPIATSAARRRRRELLPTSRRWRVSRVLRAAAAAGVPALELRAVSNAYDADARSLARSTRRSRPSRSAVHDPARGVRA